MTDAPPRSQRRWPRRTLIGLVVFAVVFHLGGGWYFSGLLRSDGLEPRAPSHDLGVRVVEVDEDSIVLDGTDRRAIEHPGVFGLWWEDGYGRVGEILTLGDGEVRREWALVDGAPPPTCASEDLAQCTEVDLEGYVYPADPSDVGLSFSEVTYESPLGAMGAWLVEPSGSATVETGLLSEPAQPSDVWAIHMHGLGAERREAVRMLSTYSEAGITSLVVDYRNDPGAPADPSGLYQFGRTEWEDAEAAVQYALDNGADSVILAGYSTGAAAEMAFLENSPLADRVVGVTFDAPNLDFGRAVSVEASRRTIPGTPIPLPPTLTATAKWIAGLRYDVDWGAIDYVSRGGILQVPALVFHGDDDQTVPLSVSEDLAALYSDLVVLVVTEDADHVLSWNVDPERYEGLLLDHLESVRGG